jgi:hypothetical protein
MWINKDVS